MRTLDDAKALIAQLASGELSSPNGCPPILLGVTLGGEVHYIPLDFQAAKIPFNPNVIIATARAMDQHQRMKIMGMFLPITFSNGPTRDPRLGGYATLQSYGERQQALFIVEDREFTERPSSYINIDLPNPFAFLTQRLLA